MNLIRWGQVTQSYTHLLSICRPMAKCFLSHAAVVIKRNLKIFLTAKDKFNIAQSKQSFYMNETALKSLFNYPSIEPKNNLE